MSRQFLLRARCGVGEKAANILGARALPRCAWRENVERTCMHKNAHRRRMSCSQSTQTSTRAQSMWNTCAHALAILRTLRGADVVVSMRARLDTCLTSTASAMPNSFAHSTSVPSERHALQMHACSAPGVRSCLVNVLSMTRLRNAQNSICRAPSELDLLSSQAHCETACARTPMVRPCAALAIHP